MKDLARPHKTSVNPFDFHIAMIIFLKEIKLMLIKIHVGIVRVWTENIGFVLMVEKGGFWGGETIEGFVNIAQVRR